MRSEQTAYLERLDHLRLLAAALVVCFHAFHRQVGDLKPDNPMLSLIDVDFTFSMDEGVTWVTGATVTSLAAQGVSSSILIKNTIPPPTQMLGPRAPRFEVTIGSWS